MTNAREDHRWTDSLLTVGAGAVTGLVAAALLRFAGWMAVPVWALLLALGYLTVMLFVRSMDRRRGRSGQSIAQIVTASVASGLAAMATPWIWRLLTTW